MEYNKMKQRLITSALTIALAGFAFGGVSIVGYATEIGENATVSGNAVSSTVSENKIPVGVGEGAEAGAIGITELKIQDGVASFKINDDRPAIYRAVLERNNEHVVTYFLDDLSGIVGETCNVKMYDYYNASGDYRVKVSIYENEESTVPVWESDYSAVYSYVMPEAKLPAPTNLRWDESQAGLFRWDRVENAFGYEYQLLDKNENSVYRGAWHYNASEPKHDFSKNLGENGPYTARVRAVSGDINNVTHSDWVSVTYTEMDTVVGNVNTKLDDCLNDINSDDKNAAEVVEELRNSVKDNNDELYVGMQTSAETRDKIQKLEEAYKEKSNISQSIDVDESLMEKDKVSILGAALNAVENANVNFKVSKASEEANDIINTDLYKNVLTFEMSLEGDGIDSSKLDIPVRITLPIPANMDPGKIKILHYSTAGAEPEVYDDSDITINGDGTFSFTITHFSTFAIVEEEIDVESESARDDDSDDDDDDSSDLYTWVPKTPDELKRYAAKGNEKIEFVPAATNAYALTVENSIQGPMCFASFEAVLRDFTIGRTYNIYPTGNKMAGVSQSVRITLTIPEALQKEGRQFQMICVTKDGTPYVLNDLDQNANTITIETNKFYAYALIYK